jgi:hypothetical protein
MYSWINMMQLHILFNQAKIWHQIVCWLLCFLPVYTSFCIMWSLNCSAEQFCDHVMQKLIKTGKNTEINKQSDVKFWLSWRKYGAVSYLLSCKENKIWNRFKCDFKMALIPLVHANKILLGSRGLACYLDLAVDLNALA